jgi:hypothetical protein
MKAARSPQSLCAAPQPPIENAANGHAPQVIAVIEIGHLHLEHSAGVARGRGDSGEDGFK